MPRITELLDEARVQTWVSLTLKLKPLTTTAFCILKYGSIPISYLGLGVVWELSKITYFHIAS